MSSLYEINKSIEELTEKMVDPETGEINVVYKRNDGDYGVLEPID